MISDDCKAKILSELNSVLDEDISVSLKAARRISNLIKSIDVMEESSFDQKIISGSPALSPGTVTIQINGIPDQDGAIEAALRKVVFDTVNQIIESRADPEVMKRRRSAYEMALGYRAEEEDLQEVPQEDII